MLAVETVDLTFKYGDITALSGVNFKAKKGEVTIVLGPNGAGKTTLLMHLNGLLKPLKGVVKIFGKEIRYDRKSLMELRRTVGYIFHNPDDQIIAPTVWQDVAFAPMNLGLKNVDEVVDRALRWMGIEHLKDRLCNTLSDGEKRRVAIAGVLAMDPKIVIMDEPTAGLDGFGVKELVEIIERLKREKKTVIISTHDLSFANEVGDYFVVMFEGRIVYEGDFVPNDVARRFGLRGVYGRLIVNESSSNTPELALIEALKGKKVVISCKDFRRIEGLLDGLPIRVEFHESHKG